MKNTIITTFLLLGSFLLVAQQEPLNVAITHNLDENSANVFDVEVKVSNFEALFSFQLFMKWDSTMFRIDGVPFVNENIPAFRTENIVLPANDQNIPNKGKVRIVWADAATLSLPDDTHIATLRFTAIGNPCDYSPFYFENIGNQESEILLASDASFNNIGVTNENVNIQIPGADCVLANTEIFSSESILVYPNPVRDNLNVEFTDQQLTDCKLRIISTEGKLVKNYKMNAGTSTYSMQGLTEGSYLYEIIHNERTIKQGQILKVR